MSQELNSAVAVIGIDIDKNSFHIVGHDQRGAIMLRQKWSRGQVEMRLAINDRRWSLPSRTIKALAAKDHSHNLVSCVTISADLKIAPNCC